MGTDPRLIESSVGLGAAAKFSVFQLESTHQELMVADLLSFETIFYWIRVAISRFRHSIRLVSEAMGSNDHLHRLNVQALLIGDQGPQYCSLVSALES